MMRSWILRGTSGLGPKTIQIRRRPAHSIALIVIFYARDRTMGTVFRTGLSSTQMAVSSGTQIPCFA